MMSAPAASHMRAASATVAGSEPNTCTASGCSSRAMRRYPSVRALPYERPQAETISEHTRPAPKRRPWRRKACTETPAMGASTTREPISTVPIRNGEARARYARLAESGGLHGATQCTLRFGAVETHVFRAP